MANSLYLNKSKTQQGVAQRQRGPSLVDNRGASQALQLVDKRNPPTPNRALVAQRNHTGMPDQLKSGVENLSGMRMDHVRVHYNSAKPAALQAHAYAQGNQIHLAPGQEKHLPHEAWHVVQQAQGRVKPTKQMKAGVAINDHSGLEHEADVMGHKALHASHAPAQMVSYARQSAAGVAQLQTTFVNKGQGYVFNGEQVTVGKSMEAWLDPAHKLQGQSANLNTSQNDLMDAIRDEYNLDGNEVVKGHLLNDNLGGTALDNNLFPITGEANKTHLHNAESVIKEVYEQGVGLYYRVNVDGKASLKSPSATFNVHVAHWDAQTDKVGATIATNMGVSSYLNRAKRKRSELSGTGLSKGSAAHGILKKKTAKKAKKDRLRTPKKKVGDLTAYELLLRKNQPKDYKY